MVKTNGFENYFENQTRLKPVPLGWGGGWGGGGWGAGICSTANDIAIHHENMPISF